MNTLKQTITQKIKDNFRFSTLSFLFIIFFVNIFQRIFGLENSIVGVIFTIMMSASMVRDLTATPIRHFLIQSLVLVWMALSAYWVNVLPSPCSFFINFITLLMILYAFTYEYSSHMYFPYILSYLFLIFISPVTDAGHLPKRLLCMLAGAVSIILYQMFMGRKRVVETAKDVLTEMIDDIQLFISYKLGETTEKPNLSEVHLKLSKLSKTVYDRRKKVLCISDASFSMVDAGRSLEHLMFLICDSSGQTPAFYEEAAAKLKTYRSFLQEEITELPAVDPSDFQTLEDENTRTKFFSAFSYTHKKLLCMTAPVNKVHYPRTALSFKMQLQAALDLSPVRVIYALRTALLLSCATLLVQSLTLPHGKWLLFTLASVSLPYADDVPEKMKKRILATFTGGLISVIIYSLVPSAAGRTAAMMLSGYVSFYFTDYKDSFACSTIGALGGAVFMDAFGLQAVGSIFMIRIGYILIGAAISYIVNCMILPYDRAKATRHLWKKYRKTAKLLSKVCHSDKVDTQLYYNLVIQAYLQEEKLTQNADLENWIEFPKLLAECREQIFKAHRVLTAERTVFS